MAKGKTGPFPLPLTVFFVLNTPPNMLWNWRGSRGRSPMSGSWSKRPRGGGGTAARMINSSKIEFNKRSKKFSQNVSSRQKITRHIIIFSIFSFGLFPLAILSLRLFFLGFFFHGVFSRLFFLDSRIPRWNSITKDYALYIKNNHQIWCRFVKFLSKWKFYSGSGSESWFYFRFKYQNYTLYIEDTHQILSGSANFFVSTARIHVRTYVQTDRIYFCMIWVLRHTKHEHSSKGENFFSNHAVTILSFLHTSYMLRKQKCDFTNNIT